MTTTFNLIGPSQPGMKRVAPAFNVGNSTLPNVIVGLLWKLEATDGVNKVFDSGEVKLGAPDPNNFRDINSITPDEQEQWLVSALDIDAVKARLSSELEAMVAPATVIV